jgi:pimeloyl-ACP methyl ester carboxylesterase
VPPEPRRVHPHGQAERIIADPHLARQRQAALAGAVFVEFPAALCWPDSLYGPNGHFQWRCFATHWQRCDCNINFPFELLSRSRFLHKAMDIAGQVPVHRVVANRFREPLWRWLPHALHKGIEEAERRLVQQMLRWAGTFTGATNHRAEVFIRWRRFALDHMKSGVLQQLMKCVRKRALVSWLGDPDYVYSDHYHLVELPTLVLQGARDRIANPGLTRKAFFDVIPARDKQFMLFDEIAHGELEAAPIASERAYPRAIEWLEARRPVASHDPSRDR